MVINTSNPKRKRLCTATGISPPTTGRQRRVHVVRVKVEKTDYCDWRKCTPCGVCMPPKTLPRVETVSFILKVFYIVLINIAIIIIISELVTKVTNLRFGLNQKIKLPLNNLVDRFSFLFKFLKMDKYPRVDSGPVVPGPTSFCFWCPVSDDLMQLGSRSLSLPL